MAAASPSCCVASRLPSTSVPAGRRPCRPALSSRDRCRPACRSTQARPSYPACRRRPATIPPSSKSRAAHAAAPVCGSISTSQNLERPPARSRARLSRMVRPWRPDSRASAGSRVSPCPRRVTFRPISRSPASSTSSAARVLTRLPMWSRARRAPGLAWRRLTVPRSSTASCIPTRWSLRSSRAKRTTRAYWAVWPGLSRSR